MGMIIPGPDSAAYADEAGRYALNVYRIGGDQWREDYAWSVWSDGNLVGSNVNLSGPDGPAEALAVLLLHLAADADRWRVVHTRGLSPSPFSLGPDVARWAWENHGVVQQAGEAAQLWAEHRG